MRTPSAVPHRLRRAAALTFAVGFGGLSLAAFYLFISRPLPPASRPHPEAVILTQGTENTPPIAPLAPEPASPIPPPVVPLSPPAPALTAGNEVGTRANDGENANILARGFAVWESNRSGAWRIWFRRFDEEFPSQLTPDEPGRQHCCPHISPDGRHVAYVRLPNGQEGYPRSGAAGPLHLIDIANGTDRVLAAEARTYFEHRAVIWQDAQTLHFIDAEGRSTALDVAKGTTRRLTQASRPASGWLIDPLQRFATDGSPTFSSYDSATETVLAERNLGGCQPYFTQDGRWGFWIAGAGGPLRRFDLETRQYRNLLDKNDPRLPHGQGYMYFPMISRDQSLLAVATSNGEHDHQRANYDVFVLDIDPQTLEPLGQARRLTSDPATDRFPDIHAAPLALGRHFGEAPLRVDLELPDLGWPEGWTCDFGDGSGVRACRGHRYERPGTFRITAYAPDERSHVRHGLARVREAAPPRLLRTLIEGRQIRLDFDEALDTIELAIEFASGPRTARPRLGDTERVLWLELEDPLTTPDRLTVRGLRDRADVPNVLPPTTVNLAPMAWPSDPDGLILVWRDGHSRLPILNRDGSTLLNQFAADGRVWLNRHGAMVLRGGHFLADMPTMETLLEGARATNSLTLELWLTPEAEAADSSKAPKPIFTFSSSPRSRNLTLAQRGDDLVFRLRTPESGTNADQPEIALGKIPRGRPSHVLITYEPARLVFYLNGEPKLQSDALQGGFFHWTPRPLLIGSEWQAGPPWLGELEGLAIYNRALDADEAARNARRYRERVNARRKIPSWPVDAVLKKRAPTPSLEEIAPYREALAIFEYEVVRHHGASGETLVGTRIPVVHRVLLAGQELEVTRREIGATFPLNLHRFVDLPELESLYLSKITPEGPPGTLYASDEID